jgi:hypothetical protein
MRTGIDRSHVYGYDPLIYPGLSSLPTLGPWPDTAFSVSRHSMVPNLQQAGGLLERDAKVDFGTFRSLS